MTFSTYNSSSNPKGSDHVLCIPQITVHVKGSPKSSSHVCALLHLLPCSYMCSCNVPLMSGNHIVIDQEADADMGGSVALETCLCPV